MIYHGNKKRLMLIAIYTNSMVVGIGHAVTAWANISMAGWSMRQYQIENIFMHERVTAQMTRCLGRLTLRYTRAIAIIFSSRLNFFHEHKILLFIIILL